MSFPTPISLSSIADAKASGFDALICIFSEIAAIPELTLRAEIEALQPVDRRIGKEPVLLHLASVAGGRLILVPTGALHRDFDDVRAFSDAGKAAVQLAKAAGAIRPAMWVQGQTDARYIKAIEVAYLGICQALWQPLEGREALGETAVEPVLEVGIIGSNETVLKQVAAIEAGRRVGRDLCGAEPERMTPARFAEYCQQVFSGTAVTVAVTSDIAKLKQDYPLLMAVARSSLMVERHHPAVIRLEYNPSGAVEQTLLFAGKGLVYDTGGADLKINGGMAGMSRDKGGAAAVAGFMKTIAELAPNNLRVIAEIGAVRNSIGSDAFVADEIIRSYAGVRVRIGNTDAEGRLVLADLLAHLHRDAQTAINPVLFTVATLTGHAARAVGPYTALVENGASTRLALSRKIAEAGEVWGDPSELSSSRREDFQFIRPRTCADDVLSCNNAPSSITARGHQFPMAFLVVAAGLDQASAFNKAVPYVHIDIAGSGVDGGDWQHGKPSAAPVTSLAAAFLSL
ncbi:MAG TPA: peptidase M17 [Rheinheimera sp.]|nr:peptidase M17 [Rheinheimera sp.]